MPSSSVLSACLACLLGFTLIVTGKSPALLTLNTNRCAYSKIANYETKAELNEQNEIKGTRKTHLIALHVLRGHREGIADRLTSSSFIRQRRLFNQSVLFYQFHNGLVLKL